MDDTAETPVVDLTRARERAELEQLEQMQAAARQQGERQARDNAAAERLRSFGEQVPKGKAAAASYLRGEETISGPTGPTSSRFDASVVPAEEDPDGDHAEDR